MITIIGPHMLNNLINFWVFRCQLRDFFFYISVHSTWGSVCFNCLTTHISDSSISHNQRYRSNCLFKYLLHPRALLSCLCLLAQTPQNSPLSIFNQHSSPFLSHGGLLTVQTCLPVVMPGVTVVCVYVHFWPSTRRAEAVNFCPPWEYNLAYL